MRSRIAVVAAVALVSACAAAPSTDHASHSGHGTYAGQQSRDIKAFSEDEVKGYLSGAGMGFAKPAELNRYPGPMHALEHADKLLLTAEQRKALDALLKSHKAEARVLTAAQVDRYVQLRGYGNP